MTWPKKRTRRITVGQHDYLWADSDDRCYHSGVVTIDSAVGRYFLYADLSDCDLSWGPKDIRAAIEWAVASGWSPLKGPDIHGRWSDHDNSFSQTDGKSA